MSEQRTRVSIDGAGVLALVALTLGYAARQYDFSLPAFEDAAMLMRYAQNLAAGHGIVWNIGDHPVDGATDFLHLIVLAAVVKAGASVELAARGLGLAAHLLSIVLIYLGVRTSQGASRRPALLVGAYFALGPGLALIAAYFGNASFVLAVTCAWLLATWLARTAGASPGKAARVEWLFALSALVMGLVRPEGVFLAVLMAAALVWQRGLRDSRALVVKFVLTFATLGGLYFIWHWWYFGYPLPNPFYIKSGDSLHPRSVLNAAQNTLLLALPFAPLFALGVLRAGTRRDAIFALIPIVGFIAIWVAVSDEINYLYRFEYPLLPIILIGSVPLLRGLPWPATRGLRYAGLAAAFVLALGWQVYLFGSVSYSHDGRYEVAVELAPFAARGYTLATTEAGLLPFYSRWRAIDTWGLNDAWVAHHSPIASEYLAQSAPAVIMLHRFPPAGPDARSVRWQAMLDVLDQYARQNGYELAASYGIANTDTHDYYVRPDIPEHDALVALIRNTRYAWYATGQTSTNFAAGH